MAGPSLAICKTSTAGEREEKNSCYVDYLLCDPGWGVHLLPQRSGVTSKVDGTTRHTHTHTEEFCSYRRQSRRATSTLHCGFCSCRLFVREAIMIFFRSLCPRRYLAHARYFWGTKPSPTAYYITIRILCPGIACVPNTYGAQQLTLPYSSSIAAQSRQA